MRRSALFIPGNNPGMFLNASVHGADGVILDLEDAVSPRDKDAARNLVANALAALKFSCEVLVRINDIGTPYWEEDILRVAPSNPCAFVLPKVESAADIARFDSRVAEAEEKSGLPVGKIKFMALVETAVGVQNAYEIASAGPRMESIALGEVDLALNLRAAVTRSGKEMLYTRSRLVIAARAAGIDVYDTAYTDIDDIEGLLETSRYAKDLGFDGRPVIYPSHVEHVNGVFMPSEDEITDSYEILRLLKDAESQNKGAAVYKGKMVDMAHVKRAKQVIEKIETINARENP